MLESGDVVLDTARRSARRAGRWLELAPKEFGVLELLLAAQGRVVSAEELLARVWDEAADPFTRHGQGHDQPAASQARRAARDRDRRQGRLPDRRTSPRGSSGRIAGLARRLAAAHRPPALHAVYGGLFLLSGAALVATTYVLLNERPNTHSHSYRRIPHTPDDPGSLGSRDRRRGLPRPGTRALPQLAQTTGAAGARTRICMRRTRRLAVSRP